MEYPHSPCLIDNTSSKGPFSIAMLDFRSVHNPSILCQNDASKKQINMDSFSGSFGGTRVSYEKNLSHPIILLDY